MTNQDQIKALAELRFEIRFQDNFYLAIDLIDNTCFASGSKDWCEESVFQKAKLCLHSYDAIIPLIQKQPLSVMENFWMKLNKLEHDSKAGFLSTTPQQLCEALLRATGKWKE